jgi:hypothetical protein
MRFSRHGRRAAALGVACVVGGGAALLPGVASAAPVVHRGPSETVLGRTIPSWSVPFIKWAFERSSADFSKRTPTWGDCATGQRGRVFFLPIALGGTQRVSCTVAAGTPVMMSSAGATATAPERAWALDLARRDEVVQVGLKIDGVPVRIRKEDWVRKTGFSLRLPGERPGPGALGGYNFIVTGLDPGVHEVVLFDRIVAPGVVFKARLIASLTVTP